MQQTLRTLVIIFLINQRTILSNTNKFVDTSFNRFFLILLTYDDIIFVLFKSVMQIIEPGIINYVKYISNCGRTF